MSLAGLLGIRETSNERETLRGWGERGWEDKGTGAELLRKAMFPRTCSREMAS